MPEEILFLSAHYSLRLRAIKGNHYLRRAESRKLDISKGKMAVHVLLGLYGAILGYILLGLIFNFKISADIFFDLSFALLFFTVAQAFFELGGKNAFFFLLLSAIIGFAAEVLGTSTGFPFGKYSYGDLLGPKLLGVPVVVPLVWFVISYIALSMTIQFRSVDLKSNPLSTRFSIALLASFGAMGWDILIDPMFTSYSYWTWNSKQIFAVPTLSGIPVTNFAGWFVLVFAMISIYLYALRKSGPVVKKRTNTLDSYIVYAMLLVDGVVANWSLGNSLVIVIGASAMLIFFVLSLFRARIVAAKRINGSLQGESPPQPLKVK